MKSDLDKQLEGNGALIRLAQALYLYGMNADKVECTTLLERARATPKASLETILKILYRLGICHRQHRQWQKSILTFRELRSQCGQGGYFGRYRVLANLGEAITWLGWRAYLRDSVVWDENVLNQLRGFYAEERLHSFLPILHGLGVETYAKDEQNRILLCERMRHNSFDSALTAWKVHLSETGTEQLPPLLLCYYLTKRLYFMSPAEFGTQINAIRLETLKLWCESARTGLENYLRPSEGSITPLLDLFMRCNGRLCLIYVLLCDCKHLFVDGKAKAEAEVQEKIKSLREDCSGDRLSNECKAVKLRIEEFEPTIYSERFEREVDVSTFCNEVTTLV